MPVLPPPIRPTRKLAAAARAAKRLQYRRGNAQGVVPTAAVWHPRGSVGHIAGHSSDYGNRRCPRDRVRSTIRRSASSRSTSNGHQGGYPAPTRPPRKDHPGRAAPGPIFGEVEYVDTSARRETAGTTATVTTESRETRVATAAESHHTTPKVNAQEGVALGPDLLHAAPAKEPADAHDRHEAQPVAGREAINASQGLDSRAQRRSEAYRYGATYESESAVDLALKWLAAHQMPDGGWCFNHQLAPYCNGQCRNPGQLVEARVAATALGVLPFLGAGQTYQVGRYQQTVRSGLLFLMRQMQIQPAGGSLCDRPGRMYGHGLATIALCEAYGMTSGPNALGQQVSDSPGAEPRRAKEPGAFKLRVRPCFPAWLKPPNTRWCSSPRQRTRREEAGATIPAWPAIRRSSAGRSWPCAVGAWRTSTSICDVLRVPGIFSTRCKARVAPTMAIRALIGPPWPPRLSACCAACIWAGNTTTRPWSKACRRRARGPSSGNMYYNYYATQVLHHFGGERWNIWNVQMRDMLVATQAKTGHETGSWFFAGTTRGRNPGAGFIARPWLP